MSENQMGYGGCLKGNIYKEMKSPEVMPNTIENSMNSIIESRLNIERNVRNLEETLEVITGVKLPPVKEETTEGESLAKALQNFSRQFEVIASRLGEINAYFYDILGRK